ncbi:MAG: O-antigen ligase family protein [Tepidisphaeraceae bacterium]
MSIGIPLTNFTRTGAPFIGTARSQRRWLRLAQLLIIGYSSMGRSFAYIGIAPAKMFIGELALGWFILRKFRTIDWAVFRLPKSRPIELLRIAFLTFLLYGAVMIGYGIFEGRPILGVLLNSGFNYYALYLVMGLWLGYTQPESLPRTIRALAWIHGIYGVAYVVYLNQAAVPLPWAGGVDMFGQPGASATAIIGLLAFQPRIGRALIPILLNVFVLIGMQVRSEWAAFIGAFTVWSILSQKMKQFAAVVAVGAVLTAAGLIYDIRLPGPSGRGGEISVQGVIGRAIAPFIPGEADKYVEDADSLGGTWSWRKNWWREIWKAVNDSSEREFFFGFGYGYPIADLAGYVEELVRTPHNIFFYVLCYGGWVGVAVFALFQGSICWCMWQVYKRTGQAFGVAFWLINICMALLGNSLENPFGAIPFFLISGMAIACLVKPAPVHGFPVIMPQGSEPPLARAGSGYAWTGG